ncbi:MAG: site-specific integrase, partial [Muribaculaceae bacterium]|nr:site-specific integrase [Muribaculaceae bacterium]
MTASQHPDLTRRLNDFLPDFNHWLKLERGLSANTVDGYTRDLHHLTEFLEDEEPATEVTTDMLHAFLASLHDLGLAPSSQARVVAALRSFFRYLVDAKLKSTDPTTQLESPKLVRMLPYVLTVEEIDAMIAAIPPEKEESPRN